ncbi:MAG TPA: LuxR C-terminal-related transcriptional regulator, partial [Azonexus sp.]|nr:LuxR C-terminal-related transcriptional regulator [Azonexus sp.]
LYYEQGRHDELETFLASRLESIAASGYLDCTLAAFIAAARTATIKGNLSEALAILEKAESIAIARKWPRLEAAVLLERICLFLEDNRQEEAEGCLQRLTQLSLETSNSHSSPICSAAQMHQIGKAHLAIHTGRADEAIAPLTALQHLFSKNGNELHAVRMGTLLSIANVKLDRATEAERIFRETMERAEKGGFVRSVLDQGRETGKLLSGLCAKLGDNAAYARLRQHCERTLEARNDVSGPHPERCGSPPAKENTGIPLTPKERDVLALIARGQSNKEVARDLNVAPETIKTHLKNIFFKLSVERRIQAVAKAQALGLISRESV